MNTLFFVAAAVAVLSTLLVIIQTNAVHALLYLVVSLLSVALVLFSIGAPFAAALEVIIYAGAIMVLFVFVIMMLNLGKVSEDQERRLLNPKAWVVPSLLAAALLAELAYVLFAGSAADVDLSRGMVTPREVGRALYGPYLLGVELASFLLLAGLVGAYHIGHRSPAKAAVAASHGKTMDSAGGI